MTPEALAARAVVDQLADEIALCAARIDAASHQLLTHIRRFDELKGWSKQNCKSCAHWLSWRTGVGLVAAREQVRVANALAALPLIDAAMSRGELSYSKVRAMTRVATVHNEDLLISQAKGTTGAELERICRGLRKLSAHPLDEEQRYVRRRTLQDGTVQIEMRLLPDEAERVWQALQEARLALASSKASAEAPRTEGPSPTLADAAVAVAEVSLAAKKPGRSAGADRRPLFVHLSDRRIETDGSDTSPWKAELQDGTPLCGATLLRLACDSGVVVARTDDRGDVLDIGRRRRTIPPAISRALQLRDRCCRFPGCNNAAFVDAHHIQHWAQGGRTSLRNVVLVCHAHHVALHEGGFTVYRDAAGALRFLDPDGREISNAPRPPPVTNGIGLIGEEQEARGLHIHPMTAFPRRSFIRPDWDGCVRALVWRQVRAAEAEAKRQN